MPLFRDVVGQDEAKRFLAGCVRSGKVPHALLFSGAEGSGKLALALALANYLLCENRREDDSCGACPSCRMTERLAHPDLHFAFPVVKRKGGKDSACDDFLPQWRAMLERGTYVSFRQWAEQLDAGNQQPQIYVRESDEIQRKLSLKSSQGGYKVMLVWLPEKMNAECADKLLKLLEEPPLQTVFLLVSEEPGSLPATVVSRTQRIALRPLDDAEVSGFLRRRFGLSEEDSRRLARQSEGSILKALDRMRLGDERRLQFELFTGLMRTAYRRDVRALKAWSEQAAGLGRERQKGLLEYCQRMVRESFVANFRRPEMVCMDEDEERFASRFSPFINEGNVFQVSGLLEEAQGHIERNANPRMVFFDMALRLTVEMKQG